MLKRLLLMVFHLLLDFRVTQKSHCAYVSYEGAYVTYGNGKVYWLPAIWDRRNFSLRNASGLIDDTKSSTARTMRSADATVTPLVLAALVLTAKKLASFFKDSK